MLALAAGLDEAVKWGKLCYAHGGGNVAIIHATKTYCALGFFKGALLDNPDHRLVAPGLHSQATRQLRFTMLAEIEAQEAVIRSFLAKAIAAQKAGRQIDFDEKHNLQLPDELKEAFEGDPDLASAFDRLTPGRQRGWVPHFSGATQAATRLRRIGVARGAILTGFVAQMP